MTGLGKKNECCRMASLGWITAYTGRSHALGDPLRESLLGQSNGFLSHALSLYTATALSVDEQLVAMLEIYYSSSACAFPRWIRYRGRRTDSPPAGRTVLQDGAEGCYRALFMCEATFKRRFGASPTLDLRRLNDASGMPMLCLAYAEVFRSIVFERQFLHLSGLPGFDQESADLQAVADRSSLSWGHLGVPLALLLALAAISRLSTDAAAGVLGPQDVQRRADIIERGLRAWSPGTTEPTADSMDMVRTVATKEMWRHVRPQSVLSPPQDGR